MLLVKQFLNSVGRGQHGVSDFGTMDLPPRKYFLYNTAIHRI